MKLVPSTPASRATFTFPAIALGCVAAVLVLSAAPLPAGAAPPTMDLKTLCPGIDAQLVQAVGGARLAVAGDGPLPLRMTVEDGGVRTVKFAAEVDRDAARTLRRALLQVKCDVAHEPWEFSAVVHLRHDAALPAPGMVAQRR